MTDSQRNLLILAAVAVAGVVFSGAFNIGTGIAGLFLNLAFTIVLVWFLVILYRKHSGTINHMPVAPRLVMQVSGAVLIGSIATGLTSAPFLPFPFGWAYGYPVIFWPLILLSLFGLWWGWQQRTVRW